MRWYRNDVMFGVSVPDSVKNAIQPEGVTGWDVVLAGTINLSVRFWFGPDTHSDVAVTNGAIRALQSAINNAGISMPPPQIFVETQAAAPSTAARSSAGDSDKSD